DVGSAVHRRASAARRRCRRAVNYRAAPAIHMSLSKGANRLRRCDFGDDRLTAPRLGAQLVVTVREHGYALVHTRGLTDRQLLLVGRQFGELWHPAFKILDVKYKPETLAAAHDWKPLPPHCECAYDLKPPRYVILYCQRATRAGGDLYL